MNAAAVYAITLTIRQGRTVVGTETFTSERAAWDRRDELVDQGFQVAMAGLPARTMTVDTADQLVCWDVR